MARSATKATTKKLTKATAAAAKDDTKRFAKAKFKRGAEVSWSFPNGKGIQHGSGKVIGPSETAGRTVVKRADGEKLTVYTSKLVLAG